MAPTASAISATPPAPRSTFPSGTGSPPTNKVRQSEINRDVAQVALTNTQRKLIAQLEEYYAEAVAAHDQLDSLDQSVATAAESLRLTRLRYSAGEATILEVVDAENSLTTAELAERTASSATRPPSRTSNC